MEIITSLIQLLTAIVVFLGIFYGISAWRQEFIGKKKIELAEDTLAAFFEIKDAISHIRSPASFGAEGSTREPEKGEPEEKKKLLDRDYIPFERYETHKKVFIRFRTLEYRFMVVFGIENKSIFEDIDKTVNSIFNASQMLTEPYWSNPSRDEERRLEETSQEFIQNSAKYRKILWESRNGDDEIRKKLSEIQERLESVTAPCFKESMEPYPNFIKKWLGKKD